MTRETFDSRIKRLTDEAIKDTGVVIAAAMSKVYGQTDEFAWLVEAFGGQRDRYLAGFHPAYMGQGFAWMPTWTADHAQALRFARENDAKKIAEVMDAPGKCRAVEHRWMAARQTREALALEVQAVPGDMVPFGLDAESIETFRFNSLKPQEIAGDARTQAKRIRELLHWFARLQRGSANPKWTKAHAMELAYYIATTDDRASIDIAQIEKDAWLKGVKATHDERGMMLRLGMITKAEFDAALAGQVSPASGRQG